ncbi:cytochrome b-c1 complex subunit 6-like [Olea europaea subsp. europaea]|uniref:Complex III subunit VI n=1 Tax=Olea europaea subsp. europaea TaxID=158383 RepID=A0A8S0PBS6_OLEEU|nr:cytochrome b-c1 complex subunit 6-like [Olea europaea subsp. europaea]
MVIGLQSLIKRSFHAVTPVLQHRSDDEPVDPKQELEERCKAPCTRPLKEYQACAKRIQGDESGHKHCTGQYFDYWQCVDKCVATKLFTYLK